MAERGALSLLTLLFLTLFFTEHTAAKHVDKGKCSFLFPIFTLSVVSIFSHTLLGRIFPLPPKKQTNQRGARSAAVDSEKWCQEGQHVPLASSSP